MLYVAWRLAWANKIEARYLPKKFSEFKDGKKKANQQSPESMMAFMKAFAEQHNQGQ